MQTQMMQSMGGAEGGGSDKAMARSVEMLEGLLDPQDPSGPKLPSN